MAPRAANVPYDPTMPAPSGAVDVSGSGATYQQERASPEAFGAASAGGEGVLGKNVSDVGEQMLKVANETAMIGADTSFAIKAGRLKADLMTKTGAAAYNAFPQYQKDMQAAFQESRTGLPGGAQRGFDLMAARTMANHIVDGSSYAASQLKEDLRDKYTSNNNEHFMALLDRDVAKSDERSQYHLDSLQFNSQAQIDSDHPGLKKDEETGQVTFNEETPEGRNLKDEVQRRTDMLLSQGYINRYETLAKSNVYAAYDKYQQERDKIPRSGQVVLDASFAPKLFKANTDNASFSTLQDASRSHWDMLTNPTSSSVIGTVLKNEGGLSPDGRAIYGIDKGAHPAEFAQALKIKDEQGDEAGQKYAANFYKTNFYDKRGISSLPANTQDIVMDGIVNHSTDFGNKLIQAAKNGASPSDLISMRRTEYQRLADENPAKYGQFLEGWNKRLDSFGNIQTAAGVPKTYATNENGGPLSTADYYAMHRTDILAKGDEYAEQMMPGDLALRRAVRQSLENHMNTAIQNQHQQYMLDNRNIMRAINGDFTNGKIPTTEQELRAIPNIAATLDKVAYQDPKFAETIPTLIAKSARRVTDTYSPNAYDTISRVLEPNNPDHPNRIASQDHLDKLMGRTDGTGINFRDYQEAKKGIELPDKIKNFLRKGMETVRNANGNVDGRGDLRALQFYNSAMEIYQEGQKNNVLPAEMINPESKNFIGKTDNYIVSRAQQIQNMAQNTKVSPREFNYAAIESGQTYQAPDGTWRRKP